MSVLIGEEFLSLLRCPISGARLINAESSVVDQLNRAIAERRLTNRLGESISEAIDGALYCEEANTCYLIRNNIPTLIVDDSIPLEQL